MVKHGGFFKRMKESKKKADQKNSRGSSGRSKGERKQRYNDTVDLCRVKRQHDQLEHTLIPSSSDSESESDSEGEGGQTAGVAKLNQLRGMLGCIGGGAATGGGKEEGDEELSVYDDGPGSDEEAEIDDDELFDELAANEEEEEFDEEEADGDEDEEEEDEGVNCDHCDKCLDDEDEDGTVCITCQATFCKTCFKRVHGVQTGHKVVSLREVDSGAAAANLQDGAGAGGDEEEFDDEDADGEFGAAGAGLDDDFGDDDDAEDDFQESASEDEGNVKAERSLLTLPKAKRTTTSVTDALKGVIPADDTWYQKYHQGLYGNEADSQPLAQFFPSAPGATATGNSAKQQVKALAKAPENWAEDSGINVLATFQGARRLNQLHKRVATSTNIKTLTSTPASKNKNQGQPSFLLPQVWEMWKAYKEAGSAPAASVNSVASNTKEKHIKQAAKAAKHGEVTEDLPEEAAAPLFTPVELAYLEMLSSYGDVLATNRTWENEGSYMELNCLHLINHHFKTRVVVAANNEMRRTMKNERKAKKLQRKNRGKTTERESDDDEAGAANLDDDETEFRDRGFGKTRMLLLLPMRNIALRYVDTLLAILGLDPEVQRKYENFKLDFSEVEENKDPTFKRRPLNYRRQFEGNINDTFCFGMALPRSHKETKNATSFYSHVLNSDIVIASPLGLRRRVEKNADALVGLSSIEVCLMDQANVLFFQNWQHSQEVIQLLNNTPKDTTEGLSDISRVYPWALDGKAKQHRQTVILSEWNNAAFLALLRKSDTNTGKFLISDAHVKGALSQVLTPIRQHYRRFTAATSTSVDDDRFKFFLDEIFPSSIQPAIDRQVRTIIFVPSYFDFVKLRNWMYHHHRESFTSLCEYTTLKEQRKALGVFTDLEKPILLMTERFYFFKRYFVKMAENLIFYSPPLNSMFYWLLIGKLEAAKAATSSVVVVYSKYDAHELLRVVGSDRTPRLIGDKTDAFFFVTNN